MYPDEELESEAAVSGATSSPSQDIPMEAALEKVYSTVLQATHQAFAIGSSLAKSRKEDGCKRDDRKRVVEREMGMCIELAHTMQEHIEQAIYVCR